MGIKVEFNPELALRNIKEYKEGNRKLEECIPEVLEVDKIYSFLKSEQRCYWLWGEVPLIETMGNGKWSKPKASIKILEVCHFMDNEQIYTKGTYKVVEVFNDDKIHFECTDRVGSRY
ncbi:MAG: hypothetical protein PHS07_03595 [Patescibacteria group bacterium]|nr:hypothetical protein [Patescibacteria group bacterium]